MRLTHYIRATVYARLCTIEQPITQNYKVLRLLLRIVLRMIVYLRVCSARLNVRATRARLGVHRKHEHMG